MLKLCDNCGVEFDGAPQARFHSNACRVAFRRKVAQIEGREPAHETPLETLELAHEGEPEQGEPEHGAPAGELAQPSSLEELIAKGRAGGVLSDAEEQRIRDHFGYTASETRTLAERDATASRITARPSLTEAEYVRSMLTHPELLDRKRAASHARWRYRSFVRGEMASL